MAIANLQETLLMYTMRRNALNLEITELQSRKNLAVMDQADVQSLLSSEKHSVRDYFKNLYRNDEELQALYKDYTEIPDFEDEIDKIVAKYQDQLDELTAWETAVDSQITTDSAELDEINAYMDSHKQMLQTNIQDDFKFGLDQ